MDYQLDDDEMTRMAGLVQHHKDTAATALKELFDIQDAIYRYLATPKSLRDDADLEEHIDSFEPSEAQQGLIPIPNGYTEQ